MFAFILDFLIRTYLHLNCTVGHAASKDFLEHCSSEEIQAKPREIGFVLLFFSLS